MTRRTLPQLRVPARPGAATGPRLPLAAATDGSSATLTLYGVVGGDFWFGGGIFADELVAELNGLDVDNIVVQLNSPGGDAFDGIAVYNALVRHRAHVRIEVDGLAASAASIIAMAADELVMGRGTELMIHGCSALCIGNAADMAETADLLGKLDTSASTIYAERAGGDSTTWLEAMAAETWYTAEEAVAAGLADSVAVRGDEAEAQARARSFDLAAFGYRGRDGQEPQRVAATSRARATARGIMAANTEVRMSNPTTPNQPTLAAQVAQRLGLPEGTNPDDATILAALDEVLAEGDEPGDAEPETTDEPGDADPETADDEPAGGDAPADDDQDPEAPSPASEPETVTVDAHAYAELVRRAGSGDEATARASADARMTAVNAAVADGRIPAGRRAAWLTMLENDPGAEATLAGLAPGTVPVAELGHAGDGNDNSDNDTLYRSIYGG